MPGVSNRIGGAALGAPPGHRSARPVISFAAARRLAARHGTPLLVVARLTGASG